MSKQSHNTCKHYRMFSCLSHSHSHFSTYSRAKRKLPMSKLSWANHNNLKLNHAKSAEIIFVRPRSKRAMRIPTRNISGFDWTCWVAQSAWYDNQSKIFCCKACRWAADLMCTIVICTSHTATARPAYTEALQAVFQAIVVNKLTYASPAWWGLTSADDRMRLE